ncbi:MAG: putative LPS assembly protein LptD, partial [Bacteroidia bacterium]
RINRFEWRTGKRLARLTNANFAVGTSLRQGGLTSQTTGNRQNQSPLATQDELDYINANPNQFVDFSIPWSLNMNYNLSWSKFGLTEDITQSVRLSGDVNVTPKWKVGFDTSYDLERKQFGFTSFNLYRDLHCWEMQFNWIPFGFLQSYSITIQVKASALNDLKLTRKRDWFDFAGQ